MPNAGGHPMRMWSRVASLFARKHGQQVPPAADHTIPAVVEQTSSAPDSSARRSVSLTRSPESADLQADTVQHNTQPSGKPGRAETQPEYLPSIAHESKHHGASTRGRPLVYAHKIRLTAAEEAVRTDAQRNKSRVEFETSGSAGPELPERPSEAQVMPASTSIAESVSHQIYGSATLGRVEPASTPRFAMLQAVAEQIRPADTKCHYFVVVGSPAEARRLAPVIRALRRQHQAPEAVQVCVAGERSEFTVEALEVLDVVADLELNIAEHSLTIEETRTRMITGFGRVFLALKPDWVIVQGDGIAAAMASIAGYYATVPVARVDGATLAQEYSEGDEPNTASLHHRISSLFASVHFADTIIAKELLIREGVPESYILVTGSPTIDAMQETCEALGLHSGERGARSSGVINVLILVEESPTSGVSLSEVCLAVRTLVHSVPGLYQFVWPVKADGDGTKLVSDLLGSTPGVLLSGPAGYEQYLRQLSQCDLVLTDQENVQEEAPSLGKPLLLMRPSVDRPEALRAGITTLIGNDAQSIQIGVRTLARKLSVRHGSITNPYGDGKAANRMVDFFGGRRVLEFGRTALPKLLTSEVTPVQPLLAGVKPDL